MNDDQLLRYSRHILLPEIGIQGQETLLKSHVLVVGAGGLGSPVAIYLAASGVGKLTICDDDTVDLTNLQRQIAHSTDRIGTPKTSSAKKTLAGINPEVNVIALHQRMDATTLLQLVAEPMWWWMQVTIFRPAMPSTGSVHYRKSRLYPARRSASRGRLPYSICAMTYSPCYHCLFPADGEDQDMRCAVMGVFAPLTGIIGSVQAVETLKILLDIGQTLNGRLLLLDGLSMEWRSVKLDKDPLCRVCGAEDPRRNV